MKRTLILFILCVLSFFSFSSVAQMPNPQDQEMQMKQFLQDFTKLMDDSDKLFDDFFEDDEFFESDNLFKELNQMRKVMKDHLKGGQKNLFNNKYDQWFKNKFGINSSEVIQQDFDDRTEIHLNIPNMKDSKVDIKVKDHKVIISGELVEKFVQTDPTGHVVHQSQMTNAIHQEIPLPKSVNPDELKYELKKDGIVLVLPKSKKQTPNKKGRSMTAPQNNPVETL